MAGRKTADISIILNQDNRDGENKLMAEKDSRLSDLCLKCVQRQKRKLRKNRILLDLRFNCDKT
jgi:hypothetical protein